MDVRQKGNDIRHWRTVVHVVCVLRIIRHAPLASLKGRLHTCACMQCKRNWHHQRTWRDRQATPRAMERTLEGVSAVSVAGHVGDDGDGDGDPSGGV